MLYIWNLKMLYIWNLKLDYFFKNDPSFEELFSMLWLAVG